MAAANARTRELAAIHAARRQLALTEDSYRDLLERIAGVRSAKDLDEAGRDKVLAEFRRLGFGTASRDRPRAKGAHASKARALWLCLFQLGEVQDPSERALDSFARGITGVDSMAWNDPGQRNQVIEGLKSWAARVGYAPKPGSTAAQYQDSLMQAQWRRLHDLGAFDTRLGPHGAAVRGRGLHASLPTWLTRKAGVTGACFLTPEQFERHARELRIWIGREKAKTEPAA